MDYRNCSGNDWVEIKQESVAWHLETEVKPRLNSGYILCLLIYKFINFYFVHLKLNKMFLYCDFKLICTLSKIRNLSLWWVNSAWCRITVTSDWMDSLSLQQFMEITVFHLLFQNILIFAHVFNNWFGVIIYFLPILSCNPLYFNSLWIKKSLWIFCYFLHVFFSAWPILVQLC